MTTYDQAPQEIIDLINARIEEFFPELRDAGVTVDAMFAFNENGDPIKHNGYPAMAMIKITSLKHRIKGLKDSEIIIDKQIWDSLTEKQQAGLIDHQLMCLAVVKDKEGLVKTDDASRPKIRLSKHDYCLKWFAANARRHGPDSPEVYQAKILMKNDGDAFFLGGKNQEIIEE